MCFAVIAIVVCILVTLPGARSWGSTVATPARTLSVHAYRSGAPTHERTSALVMLPSLPDVATSWSSFRSYLETAGATVVFERGALRILDPDLAAFVGGAVGVIGTLQSIMARREAVRERLTCVYCDGLGTLTCGYCLGSGRDSSGMPCSNCAGAGKVACVSCQGSGNSVLLAEDRNLIRELAGLGTMQNELETEIDR